MTDNHAPSTQAAIASAERKVRYSHEALIDALVLNPTLHRNRWALAEMFGYAKHTIDVLMTSSAFRERLYARRQELVDPTLLATLDEQINALATRSLEVLQEKLSQPASAVSETLALKAAELGLKAAGIGGFSTKAPVPAPAAPDSLDLLARRLTGLLGARPATSEIVDVEAREPR